MIFTKRITALTLLCAGIMAGNFGCGPKDDATAPPPPPPTVAPTTPTTPPTDAMKPASSDAPAAATPGKDAPTNPGKMDAKPDKTAAKPGKPGKPVKMADGLEYTDLKVGNGEEAAEGKTVSLNYVGTLTDGKEFDNSYKRGEPFSFMIGGGGVIQGWDEGVRGMKVGGKRKLVIPGALAYGKEGHPPVIPSDATLLFTVELVAVK